MEQSDWRYRRSYDAGGFSGTFKRTVRVLPIFTVCAVISCMLGYYVFHVPLEQLGTVAAVPCLVGFALTRILTLVLPASPKESTHPSVSFQVLVVLSVFAAFIATDFLFSAAVYYGLGLRHVVIGALKIAEYSAGSALVLIIFVLVAAFPSLWTAVLVAALKLLRTQTRLTDAFLTPPWRKHWSR